MYHGWVNGSGLHDQRAWRGVPGAIESIVLADDRRGITRLRTRLPPDYLRTAASALSTHRERVLILTGFFAAGTAETDGPPGAIAVAEALQALGSTCMIVSDRYGFPLLHAGLSAVRNARGCGAAPGKILVEEVPIAGRSAAGAAAAALAASFRPELVLAVERCGLTADGRYLNMRGEDISAHTACLDPLLRHAPSIAIEDGGNEIGMGAFAGELGTLIGVREPCVTVADQLVIGAVSNWAAHGLIVVLSLVVGRNLLPAPADADRLLQRLVAAGGVDGVTLQRSCSVDGFPAPVHARLLERLHEVVQSALTSPA